MNCPNGCGPMAETKKGFACQKCYYSFIGNTAKVVKSESVTTGGEVKNKAVNEVNRIIKAELIKARLSEDYLAPWQQPWIVIQKQNYVSGRQYSGINRPLLDDFCEFYITKKKAEGMGCVLAEGAYPRRIVEWLPPKHLTDEQRATLSAAEVAEAERRKWPLSIMRDVYRYIDYGLPAKKVAGDKRHERFGSLDNFLTKLGQKIKFMESGNKCTYCQGSDIIYTPTLERFATTAEYYLAKLHESIHATAHPSRLDRYNKPKDQKSKDEEYGKEELVAEIGAAYLGRLFGLEIQKNSISYLDHWLKAIEGDSYLLLSAGQQAEKAITWLLAD